MNNIHYASIRNLDISNGEGVGVALFVQGCHFHCYNCFNLDTWDFNGGKEWTQDTEDKLIELASRPYIKRLSILGGEPLADENLDGVLHLVNRFRLLSSHKNIWLYTGYKLIIDYSESKRQRKTVFTLLPYANTNVVNDINEYRRLCENDDKRRMIAESVDFIVDGRYIDEQRDVSLKYRGSKNQRIIKVSESLKQQKVVTIE